MVTRLYLRDGVVSVAEPEPGRWVVNWRPFRDDHPDAPELVLDSAVDRLPAEDAEAVIAWAEATFTERDDRVLATVMIEDDAAPDEARSIHRLFDDAGAPAVVTASIARRSAGSLPWLVMIEVPLVTFMTGLTTAAGADGWKALKSLVTHVFQERRRVTGRGGSIQLDDGARTVILLPEVSDEGFRQVAQGDLPEREVRSTKAFRLVGTARFELATPCSQSRCATRLRHVP